LQEIEARLSRAYGRSIDASTKVGGLRVVVEALDNGELARAQIAALLLKFPDPPCDEAPGNSPDLLSKRLNECGWLLKDFDPDEHPRTGVPPNPGWFAPRDDDGDRAKRPSGVEVASNESGGARSDAGGVDVAQAEGGIDPALLLPDQSPEAVRKRIVEIAQSLVGDQRWADKNFYLPYMLNTNKCFLFVAYVAGEAGADPGTPNSYHFTPAPPFAAQWADPAFTIPGWRVLGPDEARQPGDVVAQQIGYADASGHVMFVGEGDTFVGTGDSGNGPAGTIEQIPWRASLANDPKISHGPLVYRRWVGQ
jgi:hypothetical protein